MSEEFNVSQEVRELHDKYPTWNSGDIYRHLTTDHPDIKFKLTTVQQALSRYRKKLRNPLRVVQTIQPVKLTPIQTQALSELANKRHYSSTDRIVMEMDKDNKPIDNDPPLRFTDIQPDKPVDKSIDSDDISAGFKEILKYKRYSEQEGVKMKISEITTILDKTDQLKKNEGFFIEEDKIVNRTCEAILNFAQSLEKDPAIDDMKHMFEDEEE